ncbi:hypothetical protein M405DRAFT_95561 [Rhizopogon salebrosus TDB-379]|nr:hypothetical protein M405DRAFT_95561 [Rhizopogon salebrosus TDB-379]
MYPNPTSALSSFCSETLDLNFDKFAITSCSRTTQSASDFSALKTSRLALTSSMIRFASRSLVSSTHRTNGVNYIVQVRETAATRIYGSVTTSRMLLSTASRATRERCS